MIQKSKHTRRDNCSSPPGTYYHSPHPPDKSKDSTRARPRATKTKPAQPHHNTEVSRIKEMQTLSEHKKKRIQIQKKYDGPLLPSKSSIPQDARKRESPNSSGYNDIDAYDGVINKKSKPDVQAGQATQGMNSLSIKYSTFNNDSMPPISQQRSTNPNNHLGVPSGGKQNHLGKREKYVNYPLAIPQHGKNPGLLMPSSAGHDQIGAAGNSSQLWKNNNYESVYPQALLVSSRSVVSTYNSKPVIVTTTMRKMDAGIYRPILERRHDQYAEKQFHHGSQNYLKQKACDTSTFQIPRNTSSPHWNNGANHLVINLIPGRCGLFNRGNTCFMNSALQCLSNTEPLRKYFLSSTDDTSPKYKRDINLDSPLGMRGNLAKAFGKLLKNMWKKGSSCEDPSELKSQISKIAPRFADFQQQDSQELMAFLLDGLHEDLNRVKEKQYTDLSTIDTSDISDEKLAIESWACHLLSNDSKIVEIFQGQLMATITCSECGHLSRVCDPFMFLALPIPKDLGLASIDIKDCLELSLTHETPLDSWYCTKCSKLVKASRTANIWKLPEVLIIYFKRFSSTGLYRRDKLTTLVKFPLSGLDLTTYYAKYSVADASAIYDLFAVSNHHGGIWGGHYTAYAKDINQIWCKFNDSEVTPIRDPNSVVSDAAYVLFYRHHRYQLDLPKQRSKTLL